MSGKIAKISLPSSATADERRRAENFRSRMYTAVSKNNQERLNHIHDEVEAFVRGIAGASVGPRVTLAADPAPPVELLDLVAPAERVPDEPVPMIPQEELNAAIQQAEVRLKASALILSLGDTVPSVVRAWAIQQVIHA